MFDHSTDCFNPNDAMGNGRRLCTCGADARAEAHAKGRRSGYIATVTALQNAFRPGINIDERDPDKVIPRVVALVTGA